MRIRTKELLQDALKWALPLALLTSAACAGRDPASPPPPPPPDQPNAPTAVSTTPSTGVGDVNPAPNHPTAKVPSDLPIGVSPVLYAISVAPGQEPTPEQVKLGDKLFDDVRLSADNTVACKTCHDPKRGFVDHEVTSVGIGKKHGQRNAPTVLNAMFNATQFWDGRAATLEDQAKLPILNPVEMGMKSGDEVVAKLAAIPEYRKAFLDVYGREVNYEDVGRAIAAFERTQFSGNAPFDRFIMGDDKAIDAQAKRGWALFNGKGRCNECHAGNAVNPLFSDQKFHNIGVAAKTSNFADLAREAQGAVDRGNQEEIDRLALESKFTNLGRFLVSKRHNDIGAFKTPTLRNIAVTAPYMHDGSFATLYDVIDHYNKGGIVNPYLDGGMQRLGLTEPEIDDLVHFLGTLTSERYDAYGKTEMARMNGKKGQRPERDTLVATGKKGDTGDVGPTPDAKIKDPSSDGVYGVFDAAKK